MKNKKVLPSSASFQILRFYSNGIVIEKTLTVLIVIIRMMTACETKLKLVFSEAISP